MGNSWSTKCIPDLAGKYAVVTGANSGIGFVTALELGRAGARVTIVCRNAERCAAALQKMREEVPKGQFDSILGDVSSLDSVQKVAAELIKRDVPIDILVNNAGVCRPSKRIVSADGFEIQMATNHLGPFALTGQLLPLLKRSKTPRVVAVSSIAALRAYKYPGAIDFLKKDYDPWPIYNESKLANLLFMKELGRRYPHITAVAGHPGISDTNLFSHIESFQTLRSVPSWFMQSPEAGAMPILRAATDPEATSGTYYGTRYGAWGAPTNAMFPSAARDSAYAVEYWNASIDATGVKY